MGKDDDRIGTSGFLLLSALVLGQAVLIFSLMSNVRALEATVGDLRTDVRSQLRGMDAFIKFTTDGVWVRLDGDEGPSIGTTRPAVHIIEFADFQCPACAAVAPRLRELLRDRSDRVRLTVKNLPLTEIHPAAFSAALGGVCADRAGRYWEFSDRLFAGQDTLEAMGATFLVSTAMELGMDSTGFVRCMESDSTREVVEDDVELAQRIGVRLTPTFFVNGKRLEGADWDLLRAAVEWELRMTRNAHPGVS